MLDRLFDELQHQQLVRIRIEAVSLDSTIVKVHRRRIARVSTTTVRNFLKRRDF